MPEGDVVGKDEVIQTTVSKVAAALVRRGLESVFDSASRRAARKSLISRKRIGNLT